MRRGSFASVLGLGLGLGIGIGTGIGIGIGIGIGGCGSSAEEPGDGDKAGDASSACNPLVGSRQPVTLGEVLAIGRAADGTVYMLDEVDGEVRAFVSDSEVLRRRRVLGSGSGTLPGVEFYDIDVESADDLPLHLYLEIPDDGEPTFTAIAMPGRNSPDAAGDGEALELLDEDALADFTLENLPPDVDIEYHARLEDGRRVVVTRPEDDWSYEDFRAFVGEEERVLEREVMSVLRARDGGSTTIELTLDGEPAELSFPVTSVNGVIMPGPATLEQDGEVLSLELLPAEAAAVDGLSFFCAR